MGFVPPLLQVQIRRFEWDRSAPMKEAIARLRDLPEVSAEALKLGLKEAPFEGGVSQLEQALEMMEEDATLLTVLNHIAVLTGGVCRVFSSEYRWQPASRVRVLVPSIAAEALGRPHGATVGSG